MPQSTSSPLTGIAKIAVASWYPMTTSDVSRNAASVSWNKSVVKTTAYFIDMFKAQLLTMLLRYIAVRVALI